MVEVSYPTDMTTNTNPRTTVNIFLQGKVHLPHPTRTVRNNRGEDPRPIPACGQRSSRFIPSRIEAPVTCAKCLAS